MQPPAANRTPWPSRLARLVRLALHVASGFVLTFVRYPRLSEHRRDAEKRLWSRRLIELLSISVRTGSDVPVLPDRCMLALNHISWLDIFVVNSIFPATFLAKSEIRRWPVAGWLSTSAGTLYIERGKRAAVRRTRENITGALAQGRLIAVFPEGKTSFGTSVQRFHAALFQPAIDANAIVQPAAIRYLDVAGRHAAAAGYVGETSLLESMWTILGTHHMVAEVLFCDPIAAAGETRHSLAGKTESAIALALGVPGRHTSPETGERPRAVSR